jgi:hypothetical protein
LFEVDPAVKYEVRVKEFATKFRASKCVAFAFTWKGGLVYSALSSVDGVQIFSMTSRTAHPRHTWQGNGVSVPPDDSAVLLKLTAKTLQTNSNRRMLMIFDGVSDLLASLGLEKTSGLLKSQKEMLSKEPNATALFVVKRLPQDEKAVRIIGGLHGPHLIRRFRPHHDARDVGSERPKGSAAESPRFKIRAKQTRKV